MGDFRFEIWPTDYPLITQHFGTNRAYFSQFGLPGHEGIDVKAAESSRIYCVSPGEVYLVHKTADNHNYGIHVRVEHNEGYRTIYGHLEKALVNEGQILEAGAILGIAGSTGNSFGPNLHLTLKRSLDVSRSLAVEVERGIAKRWPREIIDPTPFLLPLLGWNEPAGPLLEGWVLAGAIFECGELAQVNMGGANFHVDAEKSYLLPAGTLVKVLRRKDQYRLVGVPKVAVGQYDISAVVPEPGPPPLMATVDGWAWQRYLVVVGDQAIIGAHGLSLRAGPDKNAANMGMVKSGSTVSVLGAAKNQFRPVRIRRTDFVEPVALVDLPPVLNGDGLSEDDQSDGFFGWVLTQYLGPYDGDLALTSKFGVNLRNRPDAEGINMGLVKAFATVRITGENENEYSPVSIRQADVINMTVPRPDVTLPERLNSTGPAVPRPLPDEEAVPGWAFTADLKIESDGARVSPRVSSLHAEPRRDAERLGAILSGSVVTVTGLPQGEYTPIRVGEAMLQPNGEYGESLEEESSIMGAARIGLHAGFDHEDLEGEHQAYAKFRPGLITAVSSAAFSEIERLAKEQRQAQWIVRVNMSFDGRLITPGQFFGETIGDTRRMVKLLGKRLAGVELHNEPNLEKEGFGSSWTDGNAFEIWWLELLDKYRSALPSAPFLYPGLSIGGRVTGVKADHIHFLESSRGALAAADGIAVHLFWSELSGMDKALEILDDYTSRIRDKAIWITRAGWTGSPLSEESTAAEYLRFWSRLQKRPLVRGEAYLTGSAPGSDFEIPKLIGTEIPEIIGRR